jgi:hypothetical protein
MSQDRKFIAKITEALPTEKDGLSNETKQWWIEHPKELWEALRLVLCPARWFLHQFLADQKFDVIDEGIVPENFPPDRNPVRSQEFQLFTFEKAMDDSEVQVEMSKTGWVPANICEFLTWKEWDEKITVRITGSKTENFGCEVVCFESSGKKTLTRPRASGGKCLNAGWLGVKI